MKNSFVVLCLLAITCSAAGADYLPQPRQYTFVNAVDFQTMTVYRDGDKAAADIVMPKGPHRPKATHIRMVVELPSTRNVQWHPDDPAATCTWQSGTWGDPFDNWEQMASDSDVTPKEIGKEKVNGFATTVFEVSEPGASTRLWRDDKYGLLIKATMSIGDRSATPVNVTQFKVGPPPASFFRIPAECKEQH